MNPATSLGLALGLGDAMSPGQIERVGEVIEGARADAEARLRAVISAARAGQPQAVRKLKIFGAVEDPALATKLALMNNRQRRVYLASIRKANGKARARDLGGAGKKKEKKR
jgi:hypothetical protein